MKAEKILEVVNIYEETLRGREPTRADAKKAVHWGDDKESNISIANRDMARAHVKWMLGQIPLLLEQKRLEKANRWLGFIQGILWLSGLFSIEEMMRHNRPVGEELPVDRI